MKLDFNCFMKKYNLLAFILILVVYDSFSQHKKLSDSYYSQGLDKLLFSKYKDADSLFSLSIEYYEKEDAFVNRAISRKNLNDTIGYCKDLEYASFGNNKLCKTYIKECCKVDTIYYEIETKIVDSLNYFRKASVMQYKNSSVVTYSFYGFNNEILLNLDIDGIDTIFAGKGVLPGEFPGGNLKLQKFIKKKCKSRMNSKVARIPGVVYVEFILDEDGKLIEDKVRAGISKELNSIALSSVKEMPQWTPALYQNRKVKCRYVLPIRFGNN